VSGIIYGDSIHPLPYVNVHVKGQNKGIMSNLQGFYSITVQASDTISFSSIGYKTELYILEEDCSTNSIIYHLHLKEDTIMLKETTVTPWSNYEQFKHAFLHEKIADDDLTRAKKNLDKLQLDRLRSQMSTPSSVLQQHSINNQISQIENQGMPTSLPFMNPMNLIGLIKSIEDGSIIDFYKDNN
jgi:hypothetical protein